MAAARAASRYHVPFFMEVRDLWPAAFVQLGVLKRRWLIGLLEKWEIALYRRADRVITVTDAFRVDLISRGIPAQKIISIPNGADEDYWKPMESSTDLRQKLGLEGRFIVLYIGAHGISQALKRILEVARQLEAFPEIHFLFVGEGAEKEMLKEYAHAERLSNVQFLDPVGKEAVRGFYASADVCLVPLRDIPLFETFIPSKMFEMLAMGRAIVASVRGEAADILKRSEGAIVVEPENSCAIAEAILVLFKCRDRLRSMGERGRRFVIENFSRRSLARRYLSVVNDAILESRP